MLKKNDRIKLIITDMTVKGEGVGKYDGLAFFVKDAVIGDEVLAVVTKLKKGYGYARTLEVISASADRVKPVCPIASRCGGCQLMQLSYGAQLHFKEELVKNNLKRIGGQKAHEFYPIIAMNDDNGGSTSPVHFRNKLQFPVGWDSLGHVITGFYAGRTHHIISSLSCCVSPAVNDKIMECVRGFLERNRISAYNEETGQGTVRHVLIRNAFYTGQIMVCLVINSDSLGSGSLEERFAQELLSMELSSAEQSSPELMENGRDRSGCKWKITSICLNINKNRSNVILGDEVRCIWGDPFITEKIESTHEGMAPLTFTVSPLSFFQTNPEQTVKLYDRVLEYAGLKGTETVWDLYCGTGTISLFLAQKAEKVYGVEIIPEAVADACKNASLNNIRNAQFICGRSEEVFPAKAEQCDDLVVVLDPPRKGCGPELLETILAVEPDRIVYVSCDSATLARDLAILCKEKYILKKVQPVDMFPHTIHVETVCLLQRVSSTRPRSITLDVDMEDYHRIINGDDHKK